MSEARTLAQIWEAQTVEVVLEGYGFTGEAYVRLADGWLSVRGALPGERVRVTLEPGQREQSRRLYASLDAVLTPSPHRRDPLCAYDARCRGCQLRHMTMEEEYRYKADTIRQVLTRHAGLPLEAQPPVTLVVPDALARADGERMRAGLSYQRDGEGVTLGLISPGRGGLVPMRGCPALTEPARRMVRIIEEAVASRAPATLPADARDAGLAQIALLAPGHGRGLVTLVMASEGVEPDDAVMGLAQALDERLAPGVGLWITSGATRWHVRGPQRVRVPVLHRHVEVGPGAWFHATLRPAEALYATLLSWLKLEPQERLLDIGCGVGTISLLAADQVASTHGLDASLDAITAAREGAAAMGLSATTFAPGSWEKGMRELTSARARFEVATINPMREPLGERALAYLARLGVGRVAYLGPSPEASARDIKALLLQGYALERVAAVMLHPATYHVMLLALLTRAEAAQ